MSIEKLIHGKSSIDRIVSIEVEDDRTILFRELLDGSIEESEVPNQFWLLSSQNPGGWHRLDGNLHYKWGRQFEKRNDFLSARRYYERSGYDVYSIYDPKESFLVKDGYSYFKGMKVEDVSVLSFDIESTSLLPTDKDAKALIISNTFRKNGKIERRMFTYDEYESCQDMICHWADWVRSINPSIICGHNIISYDLPYLSKLLRLDGKTLDLGRDGSAIHFETYESKFRKDQTQDLHYHRCRIYGREVVDTMFLAIKYDIAAKKYESYALKKIIAQEGWEVEGRVHYDASTIRTNYQIPEEWEKIKQYAIFDADDSMTLYTKMVPPQFYLTQAVPKSFQSIVESASGSQINSMMVRNYIQDGHSIPKASPVDRYRGAISFGIPGRYDNVFKVDVRSLYPSIMLTYDIFDSVKDPKGYLKGTLDYFTTRRIENKRLAKETGDDYYIHLDSMGKIFINSIYGFYNAQGLSFNFPVGAARVTEKGRDILNKALVWASGETYEQWYLADSESEESEAVNEL